MLASWARGACDCPLWFVSTLVTTRLSRVPRFSPDRHPDPQDSSSGALAATAAPGISLITLGLQMRPLTPQCPLSVYWLTRSLTESLPLLLLPPISCSLVWFPFQIFKQCFSGLVDFHTVDELQSLFCLKFSLSKTSPLGLLPAVPVPTSPVPSEAGLCRVSEFLPGGKGVQNPDGARGCLLVTVFRLFPA